MNQPMSGGYYGVPTQLLRKVQLIQEGLDRLPVYTLTFAIPNISTTTDALSSDSTTNNNIKLKSYHELRLDLGDVVKMVIPNYKPKSYSVSALRSTEFDVTYKLYPNGRASGYLHQLIVNGSDEQQQQVYTFVKHSSRRHNDGGTHIGLIVYGVGITEGLPVARAELERDDVRQVKLVWAVRTMADTFWFTEIQQLLHLYDQRFQIIYVVSREQHPSTTSSVQIQQLVTESQDHSTNSNVTIIYGQRLHVELLQIIFESYVPYKQTVRFLSVGTKDMMSMTDDMLRAMSYPMPDHSLLPKIVEKR